MKYDFYGSDNPALSTIHPLEGKTEPGSPTGIAVSAAGLKRFRAIQNPYDLYELLLSLWSADTCAPRLRDRWSAENPTLGQCSITAFLAQDIFGGTVRGILRTGGNYHCYNVVHGIAFDLTSEQFGDETLTYSAEDPVQSREVHFRKEEKRLRYEHLKEKLAMSSLISSKSKSFSALSEEYADPKSSIHTSQPS